MSLVAAPPIVSAAGLVIEMIDASATDVRVEGTILRVERRGRSTYCFEGVGLRKLGRGEVARVAFGGATYRGELVALGPTRAILHVSGARPEHGVTPAAAAGVASHA